LVELSCKKIFDEEGKYIGIRGTNRDITNHKLTSEIYMMSPTVLVMWKNEANFPVAFASENIEKLTGYSKNEFLNNEIYYKDIILKEDIDKVIYQINMGFTKGIDELELNPYRIITKNGLIKWVKDITQVRRNLKGEALYYLGSLLDITEKIKIEEKLKQSEKKYEDLFNKTTDAILIIENGLFVNCNDAAVELLGYSNISELLQKHPSKLSPETQPDGKLSTSKAEEMMNFAIKNGSHRFEWIHQKADGTNFPVEVLLTAINNNDGGLIIHTVWRDITKRKNDEKLQHALYSISEVASSTKTLDELYRRIHIIVASLMVAENFYIAIHDQESDIISFPYYADKLRDTREPRKFASGLTEYILTEKKSCIITDQIDKELQAEGRVSPAQETSQVWVGIYLRFDGNYKGVLAVQDYDNKAAYGENELAILEFVSQQIVKAIDKKYAEVKLRQSIVDLSEAKKELEIINKNKDRFFSIIAHDLRSPFMALMGIAQMLSEEIDTMKPEDLKNLTSSFHHSTQNLFKLIENLLNWSRLQMDTHKIVPKSFDIKFAAESVINSLKLLAKNKEIEIINELDDTNVYADFECVETILRNLVNNAIKYTKRGGRIKVFSKIFDNHIELAVEDNGVGMKNNTIERLFNITDKVSEPGTEKEVGTGLGLILCKELVEKNSGEIWVESKLGKGSRFVFTLPLN